MKVNITKRIGKAQLAFQVDEPKAIDALFSAAFFASAPDKCTVCQGEDVQLEGSKADGYTFVKVRCMNSSCRATSGVGQYKDGGYFWKKFEVYVAEGTSPSAFKPQAAKPQQQAPSKTEPEDDLPF